MRSGRMALIMHSRCRADLFFQSWGNFSFSGHSDSTNFFHRFADPSISRSRFLNSSIDERAWKNSRKVFRRTILHASELFFQNYWLLMFCSTRRVIPRDWEPQPETHQDHLSILLFPALLSAHCRKTRNQHSPFARLLESMTEGSFVLVEGLLNWNMPQGCPQNISSKITLRLTQPSLMVSPMSLQHPSPAREATDGVQTFSPAAQLLRHGSLEVTIRERMKEFGNIHNTVLHNPKWQEICLPVLKLELKNLRWQVLSVTPGMPDLDGSWKFWAHVGQESTLLAFP